MTMRAIRKALSVILTLCLVLALSSCSSGSVSAEDQDAAGSGAGQIILPEQKPAETGGEGKMEMEMLIGDKKVPAVWEENTSVAELEKLLPLTISMSMYGGFEQVGPIGQSITSNDSQTTTSPGDIVLYSGNQIVVFYGSNSWAYTKLGHIDLSREEMRDLLANGDVTITIQNSKVAESEPEEKTLVVYFSATGTTRGVAEKIASITDADVYEILAAEPYNSADLNYNDASSRTSKEQNDAAARPAIGSEEVSFDGYTHIYLGYPIWWGQAPRILSTFVESHDFTGITVVPFCTSGSSSIGSSGETLAKQAGSGTWLAGKRFSGSTTEAALREWIEGLE
jgi:flavodoxin